MNRSLMEVALGRKPADKVVKNGRVVNVYSKEIYPGGVAIYNGRIAALGDVEYCIGDGSEVIDAEGKLLLPGFIDGHIHPESTNLSIGAFADIVLRHGTTSIMADLHEVGVVAGMEAIEAVLDEAKETDLKLYFVVPSHVPFSPGLETSGGVFDSSTIKKALAREDAVGLSEIVGPYLLSGDEELEKAIDSTLEAGKSLQGHLPEMKGPAMNACMAAGVSTDHESLGTEDAMERLRAGCHLMMREGSAARNLRECLKAITEEGLDPGMSSIVTDDLHTIDAVERGHLDDSLRTAVDSRIDFITAVQMVTVNAARAFGMEREIGSLAPGRRADVLIAEGIEEDRGKGSDKSSGAHFRIDTVIADGITVVRSGESLRPYERAEHDPVLLETVRMKREVKPEDFMIRTGTAGDAAGAKATSGTSARVQIMRTLDWIPITYGEEATLPVEDGVVGCDVSQDLLHIAQVERYGKNGNVGKAFMGGFKMKSGAIASSIGHDNHNIIVMGADFSDMALAVNRLAELQGGQIVVNGGKVLKEVPFPVLGLLSDLSAEELAAEKRELIGHVHELGSTIPIPFMFLSFICLAAIPEYAVTDKGFINVLKQEIVDPVLEVT